MAKASGTGRSAKPIVLPPSLLLIENKEIHNKKKRKENK